MAARLLSMVDPITSMSGVFWERAAELREMLASISSGFLGPLVRIKDCSSSMRLPVDAVGRLTSAGGRGGLMVVAF